MAVLNPTAVNRLLLDLVQTIEATGGVMSVPGGVAPVGDEEWTDLGEVYLEACALLDREPVCSGEYIE